MYYVITYNVKVIQMSNISAIKNNISADVQDTSTLFLEDHIPRMIMNENHIIIFCNQSLRHLCGNIEGARLSDIFSFEKNVEQGQNSLCLKENNAEISFQFDRIPAQNNDYYIVASTQSSSDAQAFISNAEQQSSSDAPFMRLSFDACSITDNEGNFLSINQNFTNLLGYEFYELEDKNIIDIIHPDDRKKFAANLMMMPQNMMNNHITIESYCIAKNEKIHWIEWNHSNVNGKIYSAGRDLTPLKSYKESLQRQQQKLSEAEAIGHIGQWEWKVGGDKIEFSDQLYTIFGVNKGEFEPTLDNITRMIDRRDSGRMIQVFQRAIIEQNDYDMDFRLTRPDGDLRYIRCEGRCEIDKDDDVTALYGIMQDITIDTRRELDLVKAKESVERAYAAKTQFLANMSHELRTPLNAIIGFSEMIERQLLGPIGTEKYLEYISGIRESGEHLLDLISDILDMSKIEAGKYELNVEKFNIAKIIRMAAHMMEGRAVDAGIKIILEIENEDSVIVADRRAIMQMVLNILSNAVKFSHKNGRIQVKLQTYQNNYDIMVQDHGIGIPAHKLADITLPFEQAECDYTREYEGSGLGLSITKELAEIHGGDLYIESTIDVGTCVTIRLPFQTKTK